MSSILLQKTIVALPVGAGARMRVVGLAQKWVSYIRVRDGALGFQQSAADSSYFASWIVRFRDLGQDKGDIPWLVARWGCARFASIVDFLVRGMGGACWQSDVAAPRMVRGRDELYLPHILQATMQ